MAMENYADEYLECIGRKMRVRLSRNR